jgi:hypothetical protein
MNVQTGEIKAWDSLTPEQQQSGEWVKLPPYDSDGHCHARRRTVLDTLFQTSAEPALPNRLFEDAPRSGSFDALGRPTRRG